MAESEGIQSWAKRVKLATDVAAVLEENGFSTVDELSDLTPADIKEAFQDSGLLNIAQCLALKRAVASPQGANNHAHHSSTAPPPQHSYDPSSSCQPRGPLTGYHAGSPGSQPTPYPNQPPYPQPHHPDQHHHQTYPLHPSHPGYPLAPAAGMMMLGAHPHPHPLQPQPSGTAAVEPMTWSAAAPPQQAGARSWGLGGAGGVCYTAVNGLQEGCDYGGSGSGNGSGSAENFRFLLLGKTGSGKSTTGNTILGERLFNTAATFASVTSDCERKTITTGGRKIEILDSPGLYDTHKSQEEIGVVIVQAVAGMHPGPHAILYVVPLGRYTAEEFAAYQRLKALFDDTVTRYMIVVFTHGDMLEREGKSIGDLIGPSAPQNLQQVLRECSNRHVVFNNMAANRQPQVEHLLQMVRQLVRENGGRPYSCPKYSNIGQGMEEEVARRLEEVEKRDLQRQKYVQQLEQQTKEAEESARRTQEEFQRNEEERQRQMEAEEESRRQLEDQLQNHIKEQQIGFEKYQQELEQLHQEREEQERMMREKEAQMSEMEKKRAEEQAEQMRQREQEMQALLTQQEERLSRQRQEDEERRQEMERERQEFLKRMEEQRQKEIEELEKRNEEREKLWEKQREEEREAAKKKEENYEKEMEELKSQVAANKATDFIHACATAIRNFVHILAEISTGRGPNPNPYYLGQAPRRPITDGRDLFGVPHSDESRMNGEN